jgi:lipoprotein-anchoring transpeptidase ErfK/SrfK
MGRSHRRSSAISTIPCPFRDGVVYPVSISVPFARRVRYTAIAAVAVVLLAGCSDDSGDGKDSGGKGKDKDKAANVAMTPADRATDVEPASQVKVTAKKGKLTEVDVRSEDGDVVAGKVDDDGKTWLSDGKLTFGATYTVTATDDESKKAEKVGSFATAAKPGDEQSIRISSQVGDGKTYGVGMPLVLKLSQETGNREQRKAIEKGLKVETVPTTSGAWGWVSPGEVHFRPKEMWAPNTLIRVKVDTAGRKLGDGMWGRTDIQVDFRIGLQREMRADGKSHQMQILENGKVVRTVPVSLGQKKYPSSSGTLLVMDKRPEALFDSSTYGLPVNSPDGYRSKVQYPMRLTWGGEFMHSAPWSVGDQGKRNVSHGCINLAPDVAIWLYNRVQLGDPVVVANTERKVEDGDGWTEWTVDWQTWLDKSNTGEQSTEQKKK